MTNVPRRDDDKPAFARPPTSSRPMGLLAISAFAGAWMMMLILLPFAFDAVRHAHSVDVLLAIYTSVSPEFYVISILIGCVLLAFSNHQRSKMEDRDKAIADVATVPFEPGKTNEAAVQNLIIKTEGRLDPVTAMCLVKNARSAFNN